MFHQCIINVSMCITNVSDVSPMYQQCIIYVHLCTFSAHFKHIHTLFSVTKLIIICKIRILSDNMQLVREHPKTRNKIIGMHTHKNIWQQYEKNATGLNKSTTGRNSSALKIIYYFYINDFLFHIMIFQWL